MKKTLVASFLMVPSLLLGTNVYANDNSKDNLVEIVKLTPEQEEQMKGLGFTEEEIQDMDIDEFNENKNLKGKIVAEEENFYKVETSTLDNQVNKVTPVSEEEALEEISNDLPIMARAAVTSTKKTSWLKMHTSASKLTNGNIKLKNSFRWLKQPQFAFTDVVALSHSASATKVPNTVKFSYAYKDGDGKHKLGATGTKTSASGVAKKFNLKKVGANISPYDHHGYVSVQLKKGNKNDVRANGYGHYVHTEVGLSASISIKTGELYVGPNIKQSKMTDTMVLFNY